MFSKERMGQAKTRNHACSATGQELERRGLRPPLAAGAGRNDSTSGDDREYGSGLRSDHIGSVNHDERPLVGLKEPAHRPDTSGSTAIGDGPKSASIRDASGPPEVGRAKPPERRRSPSDANHRLRVG